MNGFKRGWAIARESWAVLQLQPKLLVFPVCSLVAIMVILGAAVPIGIYVGRYPAFVALDDSYRTWIFTAALFVTYFACFFFAIFFNAALIACVMEYFETGTVSIKDGLAAATRRVGPIFRWSIVAATVGLAIKTAGDALSKQAEKDLGFVAGIIVALLAGAIYAVWIAMTYFVLPVLVMEGIGPIAAFKRSSSLIDARWKDVVGGEARFGVLGLVLLVPLIVVVPFLVAGSVIAIGFAIVYVAVLCVLFSTMGTIFLAAVYKFALTGDFPSAFDQNLVQTALRTKSA
jgi:hypothetical protein